MSDPLHKHLPTDFCEGVGFGSNPDWVTTCLQMQVGARRIRKIYQGKAGIRSLTKADAPSGRGVGMFARAPRKSDFEAQVFARKLDELDASAILGALGH